MIKDDDDNKDDDGDYHDEYGYMHNDSATAITH
jgi:hypothetical protein